MNSLTFEGDFLETNDGLIFDVKGILHPIDRKIAYVRYVPAKLFHKTYENALPKDKKRIQKEIEEKFEIVVNDIRFGKEPYIKLYDFPSRFIFLSLFKPQYIFRSELYDFSLQAVPLVDIRTIHHPEQHLQNLLKNPESLVDPTLSNLVNFIKKGGNIPVSNIGLSGSSLVGLDKKKSDYDLVIYGKIESERVHSFLRGKFSQSSTFSYGSSKIDGYKGRKLRQHYNIRTKGFTNISFQDFKQAEQQKSHQFIIDGKEVFIRYVKYDRPSADLPRFENYKFVDGGRIAVNGVIIDDSHSIFTPGKYFLKISDICEGNPSGIESPIEIFTLRGRFLEQARVNDKVLVRGKLEFVKNLKTKSETRRIVLGSHPNDAIVQINRSNKKFN